VLVSAYYVYCVNDILKRDTSSYLTGVFLPIIEVGNNFIFVSLQYVQATRIICLKDLLPTARQMKSGEGSAARSEIIPGNI